MASSTSQNLLSDNTNALILEARRAGETYLTTQMQLAIAADQRAMTLGGILGAASSVLLGFAVSDGISSSASFLFLGLATALAIAGGLAFYSARPVLIRPPGNVPKNWYDDMAANTPVEDALREDLASIQRSIEANSALLAANGKVLGWAMLTAGGAVALAPIFALAALCR